MRKLILTRGLQASGKSTFLATPSLAPFVLSTDRLRLLLSGPAMRMEGGFAIRQGHPVNFKTYELLHKMTEERMERGDTTIIDATFSRSRDFAPFTKMAQRYGYDVLCLDFGAPLKEALVRNRARDPLARVPEEVIHKYAERILASPIPPDIKTIQYFQPRPLNTRDMVHNFLRERALDFSSARRVIHIGDIHGCFSALQEAFERLGPIESDDVVVFVGDYLDRGPENGATMRWLLDKMETEKNFIFLRGNHENHLRRHAEDVPPTTKEFSLRTAPQLADAGVTREEVGAFYGKLRDILLYRHSKKAQGVEVMVTHGGLSAVPSPTWFLSGKDCTHGVGGYDDDIDDIYARNATKAPSAEPRAPAKLPSPIVQVHGHRNTFARPHFHENASINLEGGVDAGGALRVAVLEGGEWQFLAIPSNTPIRSQEERRRGP